MTTPIETGTILDRILARTAADLIERKARESFADLEQRAMAVPVRASLARAVAAPGTSVIAEFKRASPSKGRFPVEMDPAAVAAEYADGGAVAMSVLTDEPFFQGSLVDLTAATAIAHVQPDSMAILRKDFVIDEYQILEARAAGADAVLLIVAALDQVALVRLLEFTAATGLDALVEVHDEEELARAEAMATRSYVYVGFLNTTNSDGNAELRCGAVISIDGSSSVLAANLRPVSKLLKLPNIVMTNYTTLPAVVKSAADISLQTDTDYVITFPTTSYLKTKFNDTAFDAADCPTVQISPQGEILNASNPVVFFRTTTSVGLVPTHGTVADTKDGAIVSYYGGTGQLRLTRPL